MRIMIQAIGDKIENSSFDLKLIQNQHNKNKEKNRHNVFIH